MKKLWLALLLLPVILILVSWGSLGHHVVGEIAERHLTPKTRQAVTDLLGHESLADVSTWADDIVSAHRETAPMHYINLPLGLNYDEFVKAVANQANDNVYRAIQMAMNELKDPNRSKVAKAQALKFLVHFVGDIHQPMHVSRAEDRGGNSIAVSYAGGGSSNLHGVWDTDLLETSGRNYKKLADDIDQAKPEAINKWQNDPVIKWAWESYQICSILYKEVEAPNGTEMGKDYYNSHIQLVNQRIEQAGIRLAGVLNQIYDGKTGHLYIDTVEYKASPYVLPAKSAARYIGSAGNFRGKVFSHKNMGDFVIVDLGANYPDEELIVLLKGDARSLADAIDGKTITVSGNVIDYKGKPEIEVTDQNKIQIAVTDSTANKMKGEAGPK